MNSRKLIDEMRLCDKRSAARHEQECTTGERALTVAADADFAASIETIAEQVDDLLELVQVGDELLQREKKGMTTEKQLRRVEAVQDNYERLFRIVQKMATPEIYIGHIIDAADAKDLTKLPNSCGATQIKSFVALMENCALGKDDFVQPIYKAIIKLGEKTLHRARETHKEIMRDNAAFVEREKSATLEKMGRNSEMTM
ncbi:hypothetical protein FACS1894139_07910 [Planctomycetales bacterium]|nr:hypothetical protein FACS1894107_09410 [Planctomycetales bacterium]GHT04933.1 hypothetical protein FACS1894139_07910 [Planctomycetales bacterium]